MNADPLLIAPVQEAIDSDKLISFWIKSNDFSIDLYSREADDATKRPHPVVLYADKP